MYYSLLCMRIYIGGNIFKPSPTKNLNCNSILIHCQITLIKEIYCF